MNERIRELAELSGFKVDWQHEDVQALKMARFEKFAELIVAKCVAQCEQVAAEADAMTKSEFVTDAGRMLHEGMWGGAKNCSGQIKEHFFGVEE